MENPPGYGEARGAVRARDVGNAISLGQRVSPEPGRVADGGRRRNLAWGWQGWRESGNDQHRDCAQTAQTPPPGPHHPLPLLQRLHCQRYQPTTSTITWVEPAAL